MDQEFRDVPSFKPWGPLISPNYKSENITKGDVIVASTVWGLTLVNVVIAIYLAYRQSVVSRSPLRSVYVWMIWLELVVSFVMGLECFMHIMKVIPPSFLFYFSILFWWCIQVQLLLQIIINRIRIIVPDRKFSRQIMIFTAVFVTAINISVFNIWIPARLQINHRYHVINQWWDRIEKVMYLVIDAALNWYFLKTVKANLINNGLTKYNKLVRFNSRMIIISLLMDVMIIGAMSIPNSFVYIQFHPLAYLVKLNIEMGMANLIKRIAVSTSRKHGQASIAAEFKSSDNSASNKTTNITGGARQTFTDNEHELTSVFSYQNDIEHDGRGAGHAMAGNQIKQTNEVTIRSEPNPFYESKGGIGIGIAKSRSLESMTENEDSIKSPETPRGGDSDDEAALVGRGRRWA